MIYLDNNATTPLAPEVSSTVAKCLKTNFGNPSSGHSFGTKARGAVEKARMQVAGLIGARPDEIIFTSGGTEANNMAVLGTALRNRSGHIITSAIEHPSVMNPVKHLEALGYKATYLPVDKYGMINPADVIKNIRKSTVLISIMHSNNETGTIQPIARIGEIAREKRIPFHCDTAQSIGKVRVNAKRLKTDMLTIVSHKFYGPKGVGALYIKKGIDIKPVLFGASHEGGLRPGTENVCGIAGLGRACVLAKKEMNKRVSGMKSLSGSFYKGLQKQIPGLELNGHPTRRLPNTLNLSFPDVIGSALLEKLKYDIAASTGSACHEGRHTASHVLKAMGASDKDAFSAVRLSLGRTTTEAEVRKAVRVIVKAYQAIQIYS
jgi:cysteine desulfurase